MRGNPPHLVGDHFLAHYGIKPGSREAHAFTYLNYVETAKQFGKVGGFAHLSTLVKQVRAQRLVRCYLTVATPGRALAPLIGPTHKTW